jgi:ribosomal protein S18 acetylase RimI-like enzyme
MQLTKLRAAPVLQAEVPPCARRQREPRTASQLIAGATDIRRRMTDRQQQMARVANASDVGALGALMVEFYAESGFKLSPAAAERTFAALLAAPSQGQIWLLEVDGHAAGFVVLTVSFSMEYGGLRGFVDDFFVAKQFRRRGLGRLALQAVKGECMRRGVRALLVETGPTNDAALSVYRQAGFVDTEHALLKVELSQALHAVEQ